MKYRFKFLDVTGRMHTITGDTPHDNAVDVTNDLCKNNFTTFPLDGNAIMINMNNIISVEILKGEEK